MHDSKLLSGQTFPDNFQCPTSHPYPFDLGQQCCVNEVGLNDPPAQCTDGSMACPHGAFQCVYSSTDFGETYTKMKAGTTILLVGELISTHTNSIFFRFENVEVLSMLRIRCMQGSGLFGFF